MEPSLRSELLHQAALTQIASRELKRLPTAAKDTILSAIRRSVEGARSTIWGENQKDLANATADGLSAALIDRLSLNDERIDNMLEGIDAMMALPDPIGVYSDMRTLDNGLMMARKTVPIGVLAMIYESRPNVTLDAAILALKSSNAILLRGGKEAIHSNMAIAEAIRAGIAEAGYNPDMVQLIQDTSRASSTELMKLTGYVDLLIPRGGPKLIQSVVQHATVPVLETGVGNCHLYVDKDADVAMALRIFENGKTQRTGVCNALESVLVHEAVREAWLEGLRPILEAHGIQVYASADLVAAIPGAVEATEDDWGKEYLALACSMATVASLNEAIDWIEHYSTHHSDVIVTENMATANRFLNDVDSACVYVNASSRFTDGAQFGLGAEIGISTQRLHARGPVGLRELCTYKYVIVGQGQTRP